MSENKDPDFEKILKLANESELEEKNKLFFEETYNYVMKLYDKNTLDTQLKAIKARGYFIHFVISFEDVLEKMIAIYYMGNDKEKVEEFRYTLFPKDYPMQSKINILFYIMKKKYPKFYDSLKIKFKDDFLSQIAGIRNKYAHYIFSNDIQKLGDDALLIHVTQKDGKKTTKQLSINKNILVEHITDIHVARKIIIEIIFMQILNENDRASNWGSAATE